jgi:hypothetical protein
MQFDLFGSPPGTRPFVGEAVPPYRLNPDDARADLIEFWKKRAAKSISWDADKTEGKQDDRGVTAHRSS